MEIRRTANAGVLLRLDGVSVLLDGVCTEVSPYLATPEKERIALLESPPQVVAFTHRHTDHYDAAFVSRLQNHTAGPMLGPADIQGCSQQALTAGAVKISPVPTRHLGKSDGTEHISIIVEGSRSVWFAGDAAPQQLLGRGELPRPDVLIAPYAYAIAGGWSVTQQLAPRALVLLHLPQQSNDPDGLWQQVGESLEQGSGFPVLIPKIGETVIIFPD